MPRLPLPREHGAWMMLYTPLAVGVAATYPSPIGPLVALLLACTSAFFAQNALGLLLRGRGGDNVIPWLVVFALGLSVSVAVLIVVYSAHQVLWFGPPAAGLFAWQAWWRSRTGRQIDRSVAAELATVIVLAAAAPAAIVVAQGSWPLPAIIAWAACSLFFGSSVFYVKALVGAASAASTQGRCNRRQILLMYHLFIIAVVAVASAFLDGVAVTLLVCAYVPVVVRAAYGLLTRPAAKLNLKRIGVAEIAYAVWFGVLASAALRGLA